MNTRWRHGLSRGAAAGVLIAALLSVATAPVLAQPHWKNTIEFPDEPFRVVGTSAANPDWVKFTIKVAEPDTVYYQDSNLYTFHYEFVTAELPPYVGISLEDFNEIALYEEGQELILGAVLMPASGTYPPSEIPEYGIQFVRYDPYTPDEIIALFNLVKDTVIADPGVQAFYFPTYEQWETAQEYKDYLAEHGVIVSSPDRWAEGNICYSDGWALGEVKFFEGDDIEEAYLTGALLPGDILLTDGVPAEIPFVAGILTLLPSTPNSHVAILANDYSIPFVYLAVPEDAQRAQELIGHRIVLRAYGDLGACDLRLIDVEGVLSEEQIQEILQLKIPPVLNIAPLQSYGAYSENADNLVLADIQYFGGKAANYGFIRRAIPERSFIGLGLSFDVWNEFMDQVLANGRTLGEEIEYRLGGYTWPPDMEALADSLDDVRKLINNKNNQLPTIIPPAVEASIVEILQDPQYEFDIFEKIRFRSSTNVEDSDEFTGAGLYDSYSGCLADDLDDDDEGPSWCDPEEEDERGVFRAIRKVFASFYNDNAFLQRLWYNVNEDDVGMAMLVHHSQPDPIEMANGVATLQRWGPGSLEILLVTQLGAVSVTNPSGGALPEEVRVYIYSTWVFPEIIRYSSLVQIGQTVMDYEEDYVELALLLREVADDYAAAIGQQQFVLDFEYKKLTPGGAGMPEGGLDVKQVRKLPAPDTTASVTPFLINDPQKYCTFQGEYGDVFANHRLKSRWELSSQSLWLTRENLEESFYTDAWLEYTDGCWTRWYAGQLPEFPGAWHQYDEENHATGDGWKFAFLPNQRDYALRTPYVRNLVPESESPVLTLGDLGMPEVTVEYEEPVIAWDWQGFIERREDTIRLGPPPPVLPNDELQERLFNDEDTGIQVHSVFYWPAQPGGIVIWTAPLSRWVETVIEGLTSEPIVLHGWYSQTYRPGHHNFSEYFIFEPRLEPGISDEILAELNAMGVQYIFVIGGPYPEPDVDLFLLDDVPCNAVPCTSNADCGFPAYEHYCRKRTGDCDGQGYCAPVPQACPDIWRPVCGCDGRTYSNACYAAMAGVSVDYTGACFGPCEDNTDCPATHFCAKAVGDCDGKGECKPRPQGCPDVWDPVCGCDGRTYGNECEAYAAGVSIDYWGPCKSCKDNEECKAANEYCAKEPGDCDGEGECKERPTDCIDLWAPVCGCDGNTYSNECFAAMAGVNVKYYGPCEGSYCWSNKDCPDDYYCFFHVCAVETGVCMPRPTDCPDIWDPVCGCDGQTYASACHAAMAGVSVDYEGPCENDRCWTNKECPPGHYCFFEQCAAETGVCRPRPTDCPDIWDPVCGCDGQTYASACFAAMAGVSVDYEGPCEEDRCWSNKDCKDDHYCFFEQCAAETGVCMPRPGACLDVWDPVCGCDGKTYSNACYAALAGVSVDYEGPCNGTSDHEVQP